MTFVCEFCKRGFARENTWYNHSCEKKRRWMNRDTAQGRLAFQSWQRFHELSGMRNHKKVNQEDFIQSTFYGAFSKFAQHIIDTDAVNPRAFIDYVIRNNIPVDKWCQESLYQVYVKDVVINESCEQALTRTIEWLADWANAHNKPWCEFFLLVNTNVGTMAVCNGRISPWVLYNAQTAVDFLQRCTPEQVSMIQNWAPAHVWSMKFKNNQQDADFVKSMLAQSGV